MALVPVIGLGLLTCIYLHNRKLYSSDIIASHTVGKPENLMIVAHPDDEIIFGGKELLSKKNWKVVCVTNGTMKSHNKFSIQNKRNRCVEFIRAMTHLGCSYEIWDYEDNLFSSNWDGTLGVELNRVIHEYNYKSIVTHNLHGEYGHKQHQKISQLVHKLKPQNLFVFGKCGKLNPYYDELKAIMVKYYHGQMSAFNKYASYVKYQCVIPVTF